MAANRLPNSNSEFNLRSLDLDCVKETERIILAMTETVYHQLHRQGAVVGISGGIDSSVVLALCARAFGPERVFGLLLPEKESSPESADLAHELASHYGVQTINENISGILDGFGCYRRRDEAIQRVIPEYEPGWKVKIVLPGDLLDKGTLNVFYLVVSDLEGNEYRKRLPLREYYQIVASSNFKQRARTNMLYYHAELRNYAVLGTPNKNEHDLGFFVKWGDGGYDLAPIRHLFKTQVYQLADYLEVPVSIKSRVPTTDTYPGGSTQEEFFYRLPFKTLDAIWYGFDNGVPIGEIAADLNLTEIQVTHVINDIVRKNSTTNYLRSKPLGLEN